VEASQRNPHVSPQPDGISSRNHSLRSHLVTTAIFALTAIGLFLSVAFDSFPELLGLSKTNFWNNPLRLILYAMPHANTMHWLRYSIPLVVCGWLIEPSLGSARTLCVGCLGCIIYGLCLIFLDNGMIIGCGGIASGLVGALAGYIFQLRKQLQRLQMMTYTTLVVVFCLLMISFAQNTSLVVAQICAMISGVVAVMARPSAERQVVRN